MAVLGPWADGMSDDEIEARRERARVWRLANKERHAANNATYRKRHRDRLAAKNAIAYAVRVGKLHKQPCEVCGVVEVHAHHDDYTRKMDVRWLCVRHHAEADVQRRLSTQRLITEATTR